MPLDIFKKLNDLSEDLLHPKFKLLRDNIQFQAERQVITKWADNFIDRDNKIVKEFQTTFHSTFWEFYLFKVFEEFQLQIDFTKNRPDFIINSPTDILVEAVVSNIKKDGKQEFERTSDDVNSMIEPPHLQKDFYKVLNESIVRHSNAIFSKSSKYLDKYIKCEWVNEDTPFVIALSSYDQINYGREFIYPMLALLYGYYFHPKIDDFEKKDFILKPGTESPISLGIFNDDKLKHISAIIFSCTTTLGKLASLSLSSEDYSHEFNRVINIRQDFQKPYYRIHKVDQNHPEVLTDGLFIFHNPFAENKLDREIFRNSNIVQISFDDETFDFDYLVSPLFSRINLPSYMVSQTLIDLIDQDFNG